MKSEAIATLNVSMTVIQLSHTVAAATSEQSPKNSLSL